MNVIRAFLGGARMACRGLSGMSTSLAARRPMAPWGVQLGRPGRDRGRVRRAEPPVARPIPGRPLRAQLRLEVAGTSAPLLHAAAPGDQHPFVVQCGASGPGAPFIERGCLC